MCLVKCCQKRPRKPSEKCSSNIWPRLLGIKKSKFNADYKPVGKLSNQFERKKLLTENEKENLLVTFYYNYEQWFWPKTFSTKFSVTFPVVEYSIKNQLF